MYTKETSDHTWRHPVVPAAHLLCSAFPSRRSQRGRVCVTCLKPLSLYWFFLYIFNFNPTCHCTTRRLCAVRSVCTRREAHWLRSVWSNEEVLSHVCNSFGQTGCRVRPLNESRTDTLTFSQKILYWSHYFVEGAVNSASQELCTERCDIQVFSS